MYIEPAAVSNVRSRATVQRVEPVTRISSSLVQMARSYPPFGGGEAPSNMGELPTLAGILPPRPSRSSRMTMSRIGLPVVGFVFAPACLAAANLGALAGYQVAVKSVSSRPASLAAKGSARLMMPV